MREAAQGEFCEARGEEGSGEEEEEGVLVVDVRVLGQVSASTTQSKNRHVEVKRQRRNTCGGELHTPLVVRHGTRERESATGCIHMLVKAKGLRR